MTKATRKSTSTTRAPKWNEAAARDKLAALLDAAVHLNRATGVDWQAHEALQKACEIAGDLAERTPQQAGRPAMDVGR